ncbi:MAG: hypothetical protein ACPW60_09590 [Methylohalobius sp. ZOD2]|nr:hypothetical protein [Methylothermaceae bacterium]
MSTKHNFIFPGFAFTSVGLVLVFLWLPQWSAWFASWWVGLAGGVAVALALILGWRKKLAARHVYDLLLWGSLWLWLAGWSPVFSLEALVFKVYPVYFVLLDALTGHFVLGHRERWSVEERRFLAALVQQWWFDGRLLAGLVLASLLMTGHYLIYPLAVGLLTVRHAVVMALEAD